MPPRLAYQWFSFDRPPNDNWWMRQSEQDQTSVTLRRDLQPESPTHTFYAYIELTRLKRQPTSHAEFAELARFYQTAPYEIVEVSYHQELATVQGQWCIRVESVYTMRGAPAAPRQDLTMVWRGYVCLHPGFPDIALEFIYSERGLPTELDPSLYEEGEQFLRGVRIDLAPNTPAA